MNRIKYIIAAIPTTIETVKNIIFWFTPVGGVKGIIPYKTCVYKLKSRCKGKNLIKILSLSRIKGCSLNVSGELNKLTLSGKIINSSILIDGNGNSVTMGQNTDIRNSHIVVKGDGLEIRFEDNVTIGSNCWIVSMGKKCHITIGKGSMIADDVDIWASDTHPIKDVNSDATVNQSGNIDIGIHCWIGKKACVLKNVKLGDNVIVGMGSIVTKDVPANTIVAGNPAKQIRHDVIWERHHIQI